jgi:hypothetical protein
MQEIMKECLNLLWIRIGILLGCCFLFPLQGWSEIPSVLQAKIIEISGNLKQDHPIRSQKEQDQALVLLANQVRLEVFKLKLEPLQRMQAVQLFTHIASHQTAPLAEIIPVPSEKFIPGQPDGDFERIKQKRDQSETLRQEVIALIQSNLPIHESNAEKRKSSTSNSNTNSCQSCYSPMSAPVEKLASSISSVNKVIHDPVGSPESGRSDDAPTIPAGLLFSELINETSYQGWEIHGTGVLVNHLQQRPGSKKEILKALSDLESPVSKNPLYHVNDTPIALTQETEWFFDGLEPELKKQKDATWIGYKYLLYPNAVIDTRKFTDPESSKPLPIYLLKKVPVEMGKRFEVKLDQLATEHQIKNVSQMYTQFHDAMLEQDEDSEKAKHLLKKLAGDGLALAQRTLDLKNGTHQLPLEPPPAPKIITTTGGAEYKLMGIHPNLGEVWKSPKGTRWTSHVALREMDWAAAKRYCASKGGRLPKLEEMEELKSDMEGGRGRYNASEGIPNLAGEWFWSFSVHPEGPDYFYGFDGSNGSIYGDRRDGTHSVRCVISS